MEVKFKIATEEDIEGIIKLCNACFNENTSLEYAKRIYNENKNDPNQIYVIGILNDEIVTHAKINIIPTIYEDMNIYAILDYCFKIAKDNNCKCVELWSKNFRIPAHSLYHSYGFEVMDAKFFTKDVEY